jgi:hypothetical protein
VTGKICREHSVGASLRFESQLDLVLNYGGEGGIRLLLRQHRVGLCVGSPALADADVLSAFLTFSQRFAPLRIPGEFCAE